MSLRETFPVSIGFPGINKYGQGTVVQIPKVFGHIYYVASRKVLRKTFFYTII